MANKPNDPSLELMEILERKLELLREVFMATQQELLLIDLEGLTPLLEQKEILLAKIGEIDSRLDTSGRKKGAEWEGAPQHEEIAQVVQAILENESTLETRINKEFSQLRHELREFDKQTRLRRYLEGREPETGKVNLKK